MVVLYYMPLSSPCRAILLTAKAIGLDLELKSTNLLAGEHLTPQYLKMNPQHTIPTLDDNGLYLNESRAIIAYLVDSYAKDDSLYPKDTKKRALVHQKLDFDNGTLYRGVQEAYYPIFLAKKKPTAAGLEKLDNALTFLETYLTQTKYVAGNNLTIADLTVAATLATAEACSHSFAKFPKVTEYFGRLKREVKDYQASNQQGADDFKGFVEESLKVAE